MLIAGKPTTGADFNFDCDEGVNAQTHTTIDDLTVIHEALADQIELRRTA